MLHRQSEVKFRDNQENRVTQFPKTPKNTTARPNNNFITPAPKSRVALGAKSTNVHHRQFTSAKPGKRHSPVTASKTPLTTLSKPQGKQDQVGAESLRLALQRALETGEDVPDVEYCPPPVEELPFEGHEGYVRLTQEEIMLNTPQFHPRLSHFDYDTLPTFVPMPVPSFWSEDSEETQAPRPADQQKGTRMTKVKTSSASRSAKLGRFAAPTASAQAKLKPRVALAQAESSTTANLNRTSSIRTAVSRPPLKSTGSSRVKSVTALESKVSQLTIRDKAKAKNGDDARAGENGVENGEEEDEPMISYYDDLLTGEPDIPDVSLEFDVDLDSLIQ